MNINVTLPDSALDAVAAAVEERVRKRLLGALSPAGAAPTRIKPHLSTAQKPASKPLDEPLVELVINSAITQSRNGLRSVRSIHVAKAMSATTGTEITSNQVADAWRSDPRFKELGRGWFDVKVA